MKRRLALIVAATMMAAAFAGCGNNTSAQTTGNEETKALEVKSTESASTEKVTKTEAQQEGKVLTYNEIKKSKVTWTGNSYIASHNMPFPENSEGATGYIMQFEISDEKADCMTHAECMEATLDFVWSGHPLIGNGMGFGNKQILLTDIKHYRKLEVWYLAAVTDTTFGKYKEYNKEKWVAMVSKTPYQYVENGYYDIFSNDTSVRVTFEVANDDFKGYVCCIVDKKKGAYYMARYIENNQIYKEDVAKNVIDSFDIASNVVDTGSFTAIAK